MRRLQFFAAIVAALWTIHCADPPVENTIARPRHIILMIADGCGPGMIEMAGIWKNGAVGTLAHEQLPVKLALLSNSATTGAYDPAINGTGSAGILEEPTDSAASATAMATGVHLLNGVLGLDANYQPARTILEQAESIGYSSGLVTTTAFNDATPAAFAAHTTSRYNWDVTARQMIEESPVDVIIGCGHPLYDDDGLPRGETPDYTSFGDATLFQKLRSGTAGGDADGDGAPDPWTFADSLADFRTIGTSTVPPKRFFGLLPAFSAAHALRRASSGDLRDERPGATPRNPDIPSLAETVRTALTILERDPDGFFLLIENEGTDEAGHLNGSGRAIEEVLEFEAAVEAVIAWVEANSSWEEILLIVTADHDSGLPNGPGEGSTPQPIRGVKGSIPAHRWMTMAHSNCPVPLFARGVGAGLLRDYIAIDDPVAGPAIDNIAIARLIFRLLDIR